jgi:membrane associated rhomboid family serine protease
MLFLWVFGRAVEDSLGRGLFLGAYFVCGFAATLLYHIMTRAFSPAGMLIPSLGASGAIAGVQGLFAPRFYSTPVRVFYTRYWGIPIFYVGLPILGVFLGIALAGGFGLGSSGFTLATIILLACFVIAGNETLWGEWKVKAAWLIACWVVFFDVVPLIIQSFTGSEGGGVAHWAHIGGLLCGVLYAFLIGAQKEGKTEYLVDETRQSLDNKHAANALESAQQVVMMKPDDPVGYQLLAEAYDRKDNRDEALKNYQIALDKYLRRGERSAAAKLYLEAQKKHGDWILDAPTLFILASQMAKDGDWQNSAENLTKIPYYYPEASEGEICFIRAAQIYLEKLDNPIVAMQLIHEFSNRYPESQWVLQARRLSDAAKQKQPNASQG